MLSVWPARRMAAPPASGVTTDPSSCRRARFAERGAYLRLGGVRPAFFLAADVLCAAEVLGAVALPVDALPPGANLSAGFVLAAAAAVAFSRAGLGEPARFCPLFGALARAAPRRPRAGPPPRAAFSAAHCATCSSVTSSRPVPL